MIKKCLLLLLALLPLIILAGDELRSVGLGTDISYTLVAADTAEGGNYGETYYTDVIWMGDAKAFQFYSGLFTPTNGDTILNMTDDTIEVVFQTSQNGRQWTTAVVDTFAGKDSGWSAFEVSAGDSVLGQYGRARFVWADEVEGYVPDSFNITRGLRAVLWIIARTN